MISYGAVLVALLATCSASWVNENVKRVIDVTSTVAVSRSTVQMRNIGESPADFFYVAVKCTDASGLGDLWVALPAARGAPLRALPMEPSKQVPGLDACCSGYRVNLPSPVSPGDQLTVDLRMDVAGVIKPVPEVIEGHESQYMRYVGSSYFYTPYETKLMKTSITLGSSVITSKQGLVNPYEIIAAKMTLGPYEDIDALSYKEMRVRFKNDRGFLVASRAKKEFYINHLDKIAVKEEFEIMNDGARHNGEWSRVDHTNGFASKYGSVIGDVWANLPPDATRVDYKDLIGNVTTSRLREATKTKRALQLTYRFPLMGGWQNHFWITYELALERYIKSSGWDHEMELPLFPSLHTDLLSKEMEVRVYLPEWSKGVEVVEHESLNMDVKEDIARTTLTLYGRPVVVVRLKMVRSQSKHAKVLRIKYTYNPMIKWAVPVLITMVILSMFVGFIMCVRSGLELADDAAADKKEKIW